MPRSSPIRSAFSLAGVTYQLKLVLCGKPGCRRRHGPYWYAFWKSGGRLRCKYVGKKLPRALRRHDVDVDVD